MRNGVIAVRRDGTLALMNDEAYHGFSGSARVPAVTSVDRFRMCCVNGPR